MSSAPSDPPDRTVFAPSSGPAPEAEPGPKKTVMMHAPPGPADAASSASRTAYIPQEDLAALRAQMAQQGYPGTPASGPQPGPPPAGPGPMPMDPAAARGRTEFVTPEMAQALRAQQHQATPGYGQPPTVDPAARGRTEFVSPEMAGALRAQFAAGGAPGPSPVPPATVAPGAYGANPYGPAAGSPYPPPPGAGGPASYAPPHMQGSEHGGFSSPRPAPTEYAVLQPPRPTAGDHRIDEHAPAPDHHPHHPEDEGRSGPRWGILILGGLLALTAGGVAAWLLLFDLRGDQDVAVADPVPEPKAPEPKKEEPKPQPIIQVAPPEPEPVEPEPEPLEELVPEPVVEPVKKASGSKPRPAADARTEVTVRRVKDVPLELRIGETVYRVDGQRLLRVKSGPHNVSVRPAGTSVWYSHRVNIEQAHSYELLLGDTYFELKPR